MICKCPAGAALPEVPAIKCSESFGQVQKVAFQRLIKEGGGKNSFTNEKTIMELASWETMLSATDSTKIVVSPYIQAPTAEAGAARTFGGGNETLGGVEEIIGREPTPFTGVIRKAPQEVIKALKKMQCESWGNNLGIFIFDENGTIGAIKGATNDTFYPIPIRSLFIGDKTLGGLEAPDSNAIQWTFLPNWSDDLAIVVPSFNPLTDLDIHKKVTTAKVTKVVLECPTLNTTEEFEINHAERLLRMPDNGGWQLPEKTPFEFSEENGIRYKTHKKGNNGTEEKGDDK